VQKLLDYMTELRARSIYRARERWPRIWAKTRGGRRKGRALAHVNPWHLPWQSLRRATKRHKGSRRCGGGAQVRGTRPEDGGSPASLSAQAARQRGSTGGFTGVPSSAWLYRAVLSGHRRRESQQRWRESQRRSVVGGEGLPRWHSDL
jgi:hypothetical protein